MFNIEQNTSVLRTASFRVGQGNLTLSLPERLLSAKLVSGKTINYDKVDKAILVTCSLFVLYHVELLREGQRLWAIT